jgi:serine/threonine protein kinase
MYKDKIISQNLNSLSGCNDLNLIINQDWDFPSDSVTLESFKILELIGKGSFGEVYLVELLKNKKLYAMKVLNKSKIISLRQ